jgi:hypothetical protein
MLLGDNDASTMSRPGKRPALDRKSPTARSRVGNGKMLLAGVDLRSSIYREFQDVAADLAHHMGGDPTAVEAALIEESAGLILWCRHERARLLNGEPFDLVNYTRAVNSLRRLLADIGQERRLRDVTPSINDYIKTLDGAPL